MRLWPSKAVFFGVADSFEVGTLTVHRLFCCIPTGGAPLFCRTATRAELVWYHQSVWCNLARWLFWCKLTWTSINKNLALVLLSRMGGWAETHQDGKKLLEILKKDSDLKLLLRITKPSLKWNVIWIIVQFKPRLNITFKAARREAVYIV